MGGVQKIGRGRHEVTTTISGKGQMVGWLRVGQQHHRREATAAMKLAMTALATKLAMTALAVNFIARAGGNEVGFNRSGNDNEVGNDRSGSSDWSSASQPAMPASLLASNQASARFSR